MAAEARVWVRKRRGVKGMTYHLRWLHGGKWKSRKIGSDLRVAQREAARLEDQLRTGTFVDLKRILWPEFIAEVIALLEGDHRVRAQRILEEFGSVVGATSPCAVRHAAIREYVEHLKQKGYDPQDKSQRKNCKSTINTKLSYLRAAFNTGKRLEYLVKNPLDGWNYAKAKKSRMRIVSRDEESKLLASAEKLYGFAMKVFIKFCLVTWARKGEATSLLWKDILFDEQAVLFRETKSHEDRFVPVAKSSDLFDELRRLQLLKQQDAGPFVAYVGQCEPARRRTAIAKDAGIPPFTYHDLRRTAITRAALAGMPMVTVQKIAGHRDIKTTIRYYTLVDDQALRDGVEKAARAAG